MAEAIKLKSKAVSIYDYHQVDISRFITGFSVDEAQYRKDLDRILRRFGRRESVSQVGSGDAVIVNSRSTLPRFCWDGMTVMVGKGILNREFEAQLIGMTVGERKTVFVDGGEASVEIVSVTRTVLPELTDEIVASFQMGGFPLFPICAGTALASRWKLSCWRMKYRIRLPPLSGRKSQKTARSTATRKKLPILIAKLTEKSGK